MIQCGCITYACPDSMWPCNACHELYLMHTFSTFHYSDVIMSAMAFQITNVLIICPTVCPGAHQGIHRSTSLAFVREIYRWPVDSLHNGTVTLKMFPFDEVDLEATLLTDCECVLNHRQLNCFFNNSIKHQSLVTLCGDTKLTIDKEKTNTQKLFHSENIFY